MSKKKGNPRFRDWCFTSFDINREEGIKEIECSYMIFQREVCPLTGRKHLQGFVRFKHPRMFTGVQKIFEQVVGHKKTHIEFRKASADKALEYCMKEDTRDPDFPEPFEKGDKPEQGKRTDLDAIKKRLDDRERLSTIIQDMPANYQGLKFAESYYRYAKRSKEKRDVTVFWYYGRTGTGKTRKALEETGDDVWMSCGDLKFWNGYTGEEDVILDDFRANHCTLEYLLRILDVNQVFVNIKNGFVPLLAKRIFITSCRHPEKMYRCNEHMDQLTRRITGGIFFFDEDGMHRCQPSNTSVGLVDVPGFDDDNYYEDLPFRPRN